MSWHYVIVISVTDDLRNLVVKLETRVSQLEKGSTASTPAEKSPAAKGEPVKVVEEDDDDDDVDLFGSDSEDEEAKAEKVILANVLYSIM